MATELDKLAIKNTQQKIDAAHKAINIKQHNITAAQKAKKADIPFEERSTLEKFIGSKRHTSLSKKYRATERARKRLHEQEDRLDKHGVWSKENKKGSAMGSREKDKIIEKGFPSKAKMAGGGRATHGYGRAYMKGGRAK